MATNTRQELLKALLNSIDEARVVAAMRFSGERELAQSLRSSGS